MKSYHPIKPEPVSDGAKDVSFSQKLWEKKHPSHRPTPFYFWKVEFSLRRNSLKKNRDKVFGMGKGNVYVSTKCLHSCNQLATINCYLFIGIVFFYPRVDLPAFCLLVFRFGGSRG